jgi:hypothetical protein
MQASLATFVMAAPLTRADNKPCSACLPPSTLELTTGDRRPEIVFRKLVLDDLQQADRDRISRVVVLGLTGPTRTPWDRAILT